MCGFGGVVRGSGRPVELAALARLAAAIRHRGPDGYGFFVGRRAGFAHVRLSIVDLECGAQPMTNENGQVVIAYNGEVFNWPELGRELQDRGHELRTRSDTEVLVHAWEEWGPAMLDRLNGQFALGIWDARDQSLFLARDRFGVRPLYYSEQDGDLWFASEARGLFAAGEVAAAPDAEGLDEVFTFWGARPPRTPFRGVRQLPPGGCAVWRDGRLTARRWFTPDFPAAAEEPADSLAAFAELMRSGVSMQLRADVPVGGYLSGGIDSSVICALAAKASPHQLRTFSVTFADPSLDESPHQLRMAEAVGSRHVVEHIGPGDIAAVFPEVVRHAETPLVRTAPAPMYLLARSTRRNGITVVLTGEGADELLLGYDLYKEVEVRRFCLRQPASKIRPLLFDRLYPWMAGQKGGELWRRSFLEAGGAGDPLFSHLPRFLLTSRIRDFYGPAIRDSLNGFEAMAALRADLPPRFSRWSPLRRAEYLEIETLLPGYLLSAQGDRMGMAHGVEGRFPYLDHRLFHLTAGLRERVLLRGLREKDLLRRFASGLIPPAAAERAKQPYRAPDAPAFFAPESPWVTELLSEDAVGRSGLFAPAAVAGLVRRCREGRVSSFRENQAIVAILSGQLWHRAFMTEARAAAPLDPSRADVMLHD